MRFTMELELNPERQPLNLWIAAQLHYVSHMMETASSAIEPTAPQGITDHATMRTIGTWQVIEEPEEEEEEERPHRGRNPREFCAKCSGPCRYDSEGRVQDVCIAGAPAIDGICGNPLCVCSTYEPPTIEEWHAITDAFTHYGFDAHLEGGGAAATCIEINRADGQLIFVGDNSEFWTADVYANREAWENGEPATQSLETDVPTRFEGTGRHHDPETIADAVNKVLRLHLTPAD